MPTAKPNKNTSHFDAASIEQFWLICATLPLDRPTDSSEMAVEAMEVSTRAQLVTEAAPWQDMHSPGISTSTENN